jgi:putative NIF3 family GTP cyclohydrolase 1 type 2
LGHAGTIRSPKSPLREENMSVMTKPLAAIRAYLDELLDSASSRDAEGNGLLVQGVPEIGRLGAALNTSFHAIDAAARAQVDLLIVHHAPWSEIDLHLRARKLARLSELGVSLYAAHETYRAKELGVGRRLAELVGVTVEDDTDGLVVGTAPSDDRDNWLRHLSKVLKSPVRAWPNNPRFSRVGIVAGGGGLTGYLAAALAHGCDTFLTGEGSLYTELFAKEVGLTLVYATHDGTEFPGTCALVAHTAEKFALPWVALPEANEISGGGRPPIRYDWTPSV